jgi:hypothetical protein
VSVAPSAAGQAGGVHARRVGERGARAAQARRVAGRKGLGRLASRP